MKKFLLYALEIGCYLAVAFIIGYAIFTFNAI